jgi:catechol 2,3-dioxygenase-like lactoylglutathione lyase family enzyme
MKQRLAHIAIVVNDYDEAIKFYTAKLHFDLVEDTQLSEFKALGIGETERRR